MSRVGENQPGAGPLAESRLADLPAWLLRGLEPLLLEPAGVQAGSPWWCHAPFTSWVLAHAKPRLVVGEGEAFQAAQAIARRGGWAIEWSGAGATGPADLIFLDGSWAEGETDAVMTRWKPRLAPGGAMLVHGINPGRGASLLWRDLIGCFPRAARFEFTDGAGLGLLLPGEEGAPVALQALCALPAEGAVDFRTLCAALGARWVAGQQIAGLRRETAELGRSLGAARRRNEDLHRRLDRLRVEHAAALAAEQAALKAERSAREVERSDREAERIQLRAEAQAAAQLSAVAHAEELAGLAARANAAAATMASAHDAAISRLSAAAEDRRREAIEAHAAAIAELSAGAEAEARVRAQAHARAVARLSARARAAERALGRMKVSTSWRIAQQIVRVAGRLPRSWRLAGRRALGLAWWTATGRLVERLRHRRRVQRWLLLLRASPLFDPVWYARRYRDVAVSGLEPAHHFAAYGAAEGRSPGPLFDAAWYLRCYPDVAAAGIHPLLHYLGHGAAEGREWRALAVTDVAEPASAIPAAAPMTSAAVPMIPEPPASAAAMPALPKPAPIFVTAEAPGAAAPALEPAAMSAPEAESAPINALAEEPPPLDAAIVSARETTAMPPVVPRLELLGRELPEITIFPVSVGFVLRTTPPDQLRRALESVELALDAIGQRHPGGILLADDGAAADPAEFLSWNIPCLPPATSAGFAAGHNRLMEAAFATGAEVYVAAHPGGIFHGESLIALLRMVRATGRRALVEAMRAPSELPRPVDPECYAVPWSAGASLAIPRGIYETIGGFDERLDPWGADVDFSWRARAAGFGLLACPDALFELPFREEEEPVPPACLAAAILLARKWGLGEIEAGLAARLAGAGTARSGLAMEAVPESERAAADLRGGPFFGERMW